MPARRKNATTMTAVDANHPGAPMRMKGLRTGRQMITINQPNSSGPKISDVK